MTDLTSKTRWYRLTPDRFVIGLLAVECLLWLSERFQWFGFNHQKGWTVLIAVASVGLAFVIILAWFVMALVFRWRFQFSIRSLLVLIVVVAVQCSWMTVEMKKVDRQQVAKTAFQRFPGYFLAGLMLGIGINKVVRRGKRG